MTKNFIDSTQSLRTLSKLLKFVHLFALRRGRLFDMAVKFILRFKGRLLIPYFIPKGGNPWVISRKLNQSFDHYNWEGNDSFVYL